MVRTAGEFGWCRSEWNTTTIGWICYSIMVMRMAPRCTAARLGHNGVLQVTRDTHCEMKLTRLGADCIRWSSCTTGCWTARTSCERRWATSPTTCRSGRRWRPSGTTWPATHVRRTLLAVFPARRRSTAPDTVSNYRRLLVELIALHLCHGKLLGCRSFACAADVRSAHSGLIHDLGPGLQSLRRVGT